MNLDEAVAALDRMARQKKINQSSVEKLLDEFLAESVKNMMQGNDRESQS